MSQHHVKAFDNEGHVFLDRPNGRHPALSDLAHVPLRLKLGAVGSGKEPI